MSIDQTASELAHALRAFGEALGQALSEGIARGVQDGLSRSLDLEELAERAPKRASEGLTRRLSSTPRRGGRPRGEARPCKIAGCDDAARSRGLCSRHYQQELRRERMGGDVTPAAPAPATPIEAKPPLVRRRVELEESRKVSAVPAAQPEFPPPPSEPRESSLDLAKRLFGTR